MQTSGEAADQVIPRENDHLYVFLLGTGDAGKGARVVRKDAQLRRWPMCLNVPILATCLIVQAIQTAELLLCIRGAGRYKEKKQQSRYHEVLYYSTACVIFNEIFR